MLSSTINNFIIIFFYAKWTLLSGKEIRGITKNLYVVVRMDKNSFYRELIGMIYYLLQIL